MNQIESDLVFEKNPEVITRKIADVVLLVPMKKLRLSCTGLIVLNETAAFIWDLIDGFVTTKAIHAKLIDEYDIDYATALSDVSAVMRQFIEQGVICRSNLGGVSNELPGID